MAALNTLLLALDLGPESETLLTRTMAKYVDKLDRLHVVHVVRQQLLETRQSPDSLGGDAGIRRELDHARSELRSLLRRHGLEIPVEHLHVKRGEPAFEIKRVAAELQADLVIVGSHHKQGAWLQIPGATTNCVIQGIATDVMAVHV